MMASGLTQEGMQLLLDRGLAIPVADLDESTLYNITQDGWHALYQLSLMIASTTRAQPAEQAQVAQRALALVSALDELRP